jgi:two-component system, NtrC family, response regulator PilR
LSRFSSSREDLGLGDVPATPPTDRAQIDARLEQLRAAPATLIEGALPDNLETYLDGVERDILARALERYRNNRTAAGASLGLSLRQMRYRMARLGVVVSGQDD